MSSFKQGAPIFGTVVVLILINLFLIPAAEVEAEPLVVEIVLIVVLVKVVVEVVLIVLSFLVIIAVVRILVVIVLVKVVLAVIWPIVLILDLYGSVNKSDSVVETAVVCSIVSTFSTVMVEIVTAYN